MTAFQFHAPRRARLPSCTARRLASRGQLCATKPSTTDAITRRDVIYRAIRHRLTHADYTLPRRHGLLRRVLPLPLLLLADAYVTQRVNCSPTRSTVACRDVTAQSRARHTARPSVVKI